MRACWICRAPQADGARFCSQCGVPLGAARHRDVSPLPPPTPLPPLGYHATPSGPRIAYALSGAGAETLLIVPGLVTHLAYDWQVPEIRDFYERLGRGRRLLRYDRLGGGLSDRIERAYDAEAEAEDVRGLLRALRLNPYRYPHLGPPAIRRSQVATCCD